MKKHGYTTDHVAATEPLKRTEAKSFLKWYVRSYILCHFPYVCKICRCGTSVRSARIVGGFLSGSLQLLVMSHHGTWQKNVSFLCCVP